MLVYRYTSEKELEHVLRHETSRIGDFNDDFTVWSRSNNHKYKYGHKYLHFFNHKKSIKYLRFASKKLESKKMFVCTYDIPQDVLKRGKGKGVYRMKPKGEWPEIRLNLTEYAIDIENFDCSWLVEVEKVQPQDKLEHVSCLGQC